MREIGSNCNARITHIQNVRVVLPSGWDTQLAHPRGLQHAFEPTPHRDSQFDVEGAALLP